MNGLLYRYLGDLDGNRTMLADHARLWHQRQ